MIDPYEASILNRTPETYWQGLIECGWAAETPSHLHERLRELIVNRIARDPLGVCFCLMTSGFDSECIYGVGPENSSYYDVIVLLAETSHGYFQPSNIRDVLDIEHLKIHITFTVGKKDYHISVASDNDYVDFNVIHLINQSLMENGVNHQFIELPAVDQICHLVFVSKQTYRLAEKLRLIPPPSYFMFKEDNKPEKLIGYLEKYYKDLDL